MAWFIETRIAAEESTVAASAGVAPTTARVFAGIDDETLGVELAVRDVRVTPAMISAATTTPATTAPTTQGAFDPVLAAWVPAIGTIYSRSKS